MISVHPPSPPLLALEFTRLFSRSRCVGRLGASRQAFRGSFGRSTKWRYRWCDFIREKMGGNLPDNLYGSFIWCKYPLIYVTFHVHYVLFVWGIPIAVVSRDGTPKMLCRTSSVSLSHIQNSGRNPGMFGMVKALVKSAEIMGMIAIYIFKYDIIYVCVVEEVVRNILRINNSKDWTCLKASSFNGGEIKIHIEKGSDKSKRTSWL